MYAQYYPSSPISLSAVLLHHSDTKLPRTAFLSKSRASNEYIYAIIVQLFCYEAKNT